MQVIAALNRSPARRLFRTPLADFQEVAKDSEGRPMLGYPARWFGFEPKWRVLITYRKPLAEHEEATWNDLRARVLTQL